MSTTSGLNTLEITLPKSGASVRNIPCGGLSKPVGSNTATIFGVAFSLWIVGHASAQFRCKSRTLRWQPINWAVAGHIHPTEPTMVVFSRKRVVIVHRQRG